MHSSIAMQFENKMSSCPLRKMSSCPLRKMSSCPLCKMSSCPLVQDVQLSTVQGFSKTGNQIDVDTQTLIMCILFTVSEVPALLPPPPLHHS